LILIVEVLLDILTMSVLRCYKTTCSHVAVTDSLSVDIISQNNGQMVIRWVKKSDHKLH